MWHPAKYAELLAERIERHGSNVWLVNTGWSGGAYGSGSRMPLSHTRTIIDAIHAGTIVDAPVQTDPVFGLQMVTKCHGVPDAILVPRNTWSDPSTFDQTARKLANLFRKNFETFESGVSAQVLAAGPK